jgi:hypothetical protein
MHSVFVALPAPLPVNLESIFDPRDWPAAVYFGLIASLLAIRLFVPWPNTRIAHFTEEVCLILPAGLFYFFGRGQSHTEAATAIAHSRRIVNLERSLGIFVEPRLQSHILDRPMVVDLVNWVYIWAHWPVIIPWIIWMWFRHHKDYAIYRNAVLISGAAGMLVFALYPVAPPRLVPDLGLIDTVTLHSRSYRVLQPPALTNVYAAMPSLHFGWDLLVGIAIARHAGVRAGRAVGVILPVLMLSAVVLTANHFVLDAVVGGTFALAGLTLSLIVTPRWSPWLTRPAHQRGSPPWRSATAGESARE